MLDRQKCFDLLVDDTCFGLQSAAGCPDEVLKVRRHQYQNLRARNRLAGSFGPVRPRTNGHIQGDAFSPDDLKLLMGVWLEVQHASVRGSTSVCFLDHSNTAASTSRQIQLSIAVTEHFDQLSGQQIAPNKVVGWATHQELNEEMGELVIKGMKLPMKVGSRLVGAFVQAHGKPQSDLVDARITKVIPTIGRIGRLPWGMYGKSQLVESLAAAAVATGTELQMPSQALLVQYDKAVKESLFKGSSRWVCLPLAKVVILKGHRIDLKLVAQNESFNAMRYLASKNREAVNELEVVWNSARHRTDFVASGPVFSAAADDPTTRMGLD